MRLVEIFHLGGVPMSRNGSKEVKRRRTVGIQRLLSIGIKNQSKFYETTTKRCVSARSFVWEGSPEMEETITNNVPKNRTVDFSEVVLSRRRRLRVTGGPNPGCKELAP